MDLRSLNYDLQTYLEQYSDNKEDDIGYIEKVENFINKVAVIDTKNTYKLKLTVLHNKITTIVDIDNCYCEDIKIPKYINNIYIYLPITIKLNTRKERVLSIGRVVIESSNQLHNTFKFNSRDIIPLLKYNKLYVNDLDSFNKWMIELLSSLVEEANNNYDDELNSNIIKYIMEIRNQLSLRNIKEKLDKTESIHKFLMLKDTVNYSKHKTLFNTVLEDLKQNLI